MTSHLLMVAVVLWIYMTVVWGIALWKKRNDFADIAWGPGFVVGAFTSWLGSSLFSWKSTFTLMLLSIWAARLSIYIFLRARGKGEDFRYRKWREEWGASVVWRSYVQVFLLQGFLLFLIGMPIWVELGSLPTYDLDGWVIVGSVVWVVGFAFETIADLQMAHFRKYKTDPQAFIQSGLWKFSRHPNYFGECLVWWGFFLIAFSNSVPAWTIIGPLILTFLLVKVSGVPMLEKKYRDNPNYQEYKRRTPAFIPFWRIK